MEADRDREMVDVIVKKIEAEERAEQEQYLRSRYDAIPRVRFVDKIPGECVLGRAVSTLGLLQKCSHSQVVCLQKSGRSSREVNAGIRVVPPETVI